jgi:hypothetical protein
VHVNGRNYRLYVNTRVEWQLQVAYDKVQAFSSLLHIAQCDVRGQNLTECMV